MQLSRENTIARFINLDASVERRARTEQNLACVEPVLGPAVRFAGINHAEGWKGCSLSHLAVLKEAMDSAPPEVQHLAVFEDDIIWRPGIDVAAILSKPIHHEFDMLMLAYQPWMPDLQYWQPLDTDTHLMQLRGGELAWGTAYIVHRRFWPVLHHLWTETLFQTEIDVSWRALFHQHVFLCFTPVLGNQAPGQSCIQRDQPPKLRHVDPNIALVGANSKKNITPLNKLYPTVASIRQAKEMMFDFAIHIGNDSRSASTHEINKAVHLCKRRWFHGRQGGCFDFNNPVFSCPCPFKPWS